VNQIAYIESFSLEADDNVLIADPNVGVAEDGILVTVEPSPIAADGTIMLSIELVSASLARPIRTIEASVPGSRIAVSLQTPLTMSQKLATVVRLGESEALLLGGLAANEVDRFVFAIVTAEALDPNAALSEKLPR
jgi:hypothetical protein